MGKKLFVALLAVFVAAPAFASVQNVKVGGSLKTTSVIRNSFDLGDNNATTVVNGSIMNKQQNVILSQVGLNVQADLTDNVSATLGLVNERLWGTASTSSSGETAGVDVDTAYVTMREFLYSPLTVTIGRQPIVYGNAFLIGDGDGTTDVGTVSDLTGGVNFDAVKVVLDYDPLTVDLFAAKIAETTATAQNDDDDTDLYGVNANYKLGDDMNSVIEGYVFIQRNRAAITDANAKTQRLYVPGLRLSTNPIDGLNLQMEGAYQAGNTTAGQTVKAYGLQSMVSYALPLLEDMKPVLSGSYTYLSGDKNTSDSKTTAFVTMYDDQFGDRIFDGLFAVSNLSIANVALEVVPMEDVTAKLSWYNLNLVKKTATASAIFNTTLPDGSSITPTMTGKKELGDEIDLDLSYAYTEDVTFGLSAGVFLPGDAFDARTKDKATQVLTSVNVMF